MSDSVTATPRLLFTHIPKTAGSTLRAIILRQYPEATSLNIRAGTPANNLKILQAIDQPARDAISCVIGHVHFGIHHLFPNGENAYITMLRNPVTRIISNYYYTRSNPGHPNYGLTTTLSLLEYAALPFVNTVTTAYVAGMTGTTAQTLTVAPTVDDSTLERAKSNLLNHYKVIGFTEEFDTSLLMMQKALGWAWVYYRSINTGEQLKNKEERVTLTPQLRASIEAVCPFDMALYRYALERYEAQKDAYGRDKLARDVERFQRQNRVAGQVITLGNLIKSGRLYRGLRRMLVRQK